MAEYLTWRDDWLLGIDDLDADHKKMVVLINQLANNANSVPVLERLDALIVHLHDHFDREQKFLELIAFPSTGSHIDEHTVQLAELTELKRTIAADGDEDMDDTGLRELKEWFLNHVVAEDQRYADYYHRFYMARQA